MNSWLEFLAEAAKANLSPAFDVEIEGRPVLGVDLGVPEGATGVSLAKKEKTNALGVTRASVMQLVRELAMPLGDPAPQDVTGLGDLAERMFWKVDDASPDSVTSVLFLAALQAGIYVPEEVWNTWEPVITAWEMTGNARVPESSWPALASSLSHADLGDGRVNGKWQPAGWARVVPFLVEALLAGWDPAHIPDNALGEHLTKARSAFESEKALYFRKLFASQITQVSLPRKETHRHELVDALLTREEEFTGAGLKTVARNDRENSPLGRGFTMLVMERTGIRDSSPKFWLTISLDPEAGVHLEDLWCEIETAETAAWNAAGVVRPARGAQSRVLDAVDAEKQTAHEQWYLDPTRTLLASPDHQAPPGTSENDRKHHPGSRLTTEQVLAALFRVCDPFADRSVTALDGRSIRLPDTPIAQELEGGKRVLAARWPTDNPLPHPAGQVPRSGLLPIEIRLMGALANGVPSQDAIARAPDLEDVNMVAYGDGLAVIGDGGVFLLHAGRAGPDRTERAIQMVERQAKIAAQLDSIQRRVASLAEQQASVMKGRSSSSRAIVQQGLCTTLQADVIKLRGALDTPLETEAASLAPLKSALAKRWNTRDRLAELASEIDWLQRNVQAAEELRVFRAGRWAAAFTLALLTAGNLAGRIAKWLMTFQKPEWVPWEPKSPETVELIMFCLVFVLTILLLSAARWVVRTRIDTGAE